MTSFRKVLLVFLLGTTLLITSCGPQPASRFEDAQQTSTAKGATAVVTESKSGGSFNQFFPDNSAGYERVYTQEKQGFAEAKLKKDGLEVAVLSISDTLNNPSAIAKFKQSSETIGGYPAVNQGRTGTSVLIADRFQVKIFSRDDSFTEEDRKTWLIRFDLEGLAQLN